MVHVLSDASGRHPEVSPTVAAAGRRPGPHPFMGVSLLKHRAGTNDFSPFSSSIPRFAYHIKSALNGWKGRIGDDRPLPGRLPGSVHIKDHMPGSLPVSATSDPGSM